MSDKNTMGGDTPRIASDAYYTPDPLALAIAQRVRETFGGFDWIVEPSAGQGAFVRAARAVWPQPPVYAAEPNVVGVPDGCWFPGVTWDAKPWEDAEHGALAGWKFDKWRRLVIGNPPYNLPGDGRGRDENGLSKPTTAERHVVLALNRMRDGDVLAFLLRLAFLGGGGRIERLYRKHPLAALWPVTPRPSFTEGGGTDGSEYGVFVWRKNHDGPCDLRPFGWTP